MSDTPNPLTIEERRIIVTAMDVILRVLDASGESIAAIRLSEARDALTNNPRFPLDS